MEIFKDRFVVIEYTVQLEDGSYVKGEDGPVSMNFIAGYEQVLPALEQRLLGMEEGGQREFVVPAREAFGERDPAKVRTKALSTFPEGIHLKPGKWVVATNSQTQSQYAYFVKEKDEKSVVVDFNHPLAGEDLHYRVRVVRVREALPDELAHLRPCEHGESRQGASSAASN